MIQKLRICVELDVAVRLVAFMAAHERREDIHLLPAHEQFAASGHEFCCRVSSEVGVGEAVAAHCERQGRRDHGRWSVVHRPVDVLVAGPHHCRVADGSRRAGPREEEYLAQRSGLFERFAVQLRPEGRPAVVREHRVGAVIEHGVARQVFPKICHPAAHADADHVLFDDFLVPLVCFRVRQVDHRGRECCDCDEVIFSLAVFDAIALRGGFLVQALLDGEEGVDVSEEADALLLPFGDARGQVRVEGGVVLPVPHDLVAKAGPAAAAPVLAPDSRDRDAVRAAGGELLLDYFGAFLDPGNDAVKHPVRKFGHSPQLFGKLPGELREVIRLKQQDLRVLPQFQRDLAFFCEIKCHERSPAHMKRPLAG